MIRKKISSAFQQAGVQPSHRMLIACSGGIDSVCLAHLVREMHFESAIAHVNYHKRAEASEADEVFVSHLAQSLGMAFYRIDAPVFYKGNFQDEARKFRYDWLNKLAQDFDWILTAHHAGDQRETILQKLLRGSGTLGLGGIQAVQAKVLRPLLEVDKSEIRHYASENKLNWREDASNASIHYERNYLRNIVLPHLKAHHPRGLAGLDRSIRHLITQSSRTERLLEYWRNLCLQKIPGGWEIDLDVLPVDHREDWLYDLLRPFGRFNTSDILQHMEAGANARSLNGSYVLETSLARVFLLNTGYEDLGTTHFDKKTNTVNDLQTIVRGREEDALDYFQCSSAELSAMTIRKMQDGDRIVLPNGTRKKLSDFLLEKRIPVPLRHRAVWLILHKDTIVWIPGLYRRDVVQSDQDSSLTFSYISPDFFKGY